MPHTHTHTHTHIPPPHPPSCLDSMSARAQDMLWLINTRPARQKLVESMLFAHHFNKQIIYVMTFNQRGNVKKSNQNKAM